MNKCWLITKRELGSFFNTWMGYIIVAAALFIDGLLFNAFAVGNNPKFSADVLTDFFYFASGLSMIAGIFLAMRLVAEEKQNGTIVLFYTSPISERQLIYGKFFSAFLFSLILQLVSLYLPSLIFLHGKVSLGHIAAGYLALTMLGGATIAITLFASVLSPNQLVAAIVGSLITVTLLVLWMVSDIVREPFKEIFTYLAIHSKHFTPFSRGIVTLGDVFYYLSLMIFFLELAVRILQRQRLVPRFAISWINLVLLSLSLIALNYVFFKKNRSYDWSYLKTSSVSTSTQKIIDSLSEPIEVAIFFPQSNEVLLQLKDYFEFLGQKSEKVKIHFYDKDLSPAAAEKFQTTRNGQVVLSQKGNFERIDLGQTLASARKQLKTLDQEFQKALLTLTSERRIAYFSSGHGELSWKTASNEDPLNSIKLVDTFLRSQNYLIKMWGAGEGSLKEVPSDAAVVVIARSIQPFLEEEVQALRAYLERGGSIMVFMDLDGPQESSVQVVKGRDIANDPLTKFLNGYGIKYVPTPLANTEKFVNGTNSQVDKWFLYTNRFASHESIPNLNRNDEKIAILTFRSGYLTIANEYADYENFETVRSLPDAFADENKDFTFNANEKKQAYLVGAASSRKKDAKTPDRKLGKILTFADASAISDALLRNQGNLLYFADSFKWLVGDVKTQGTVTSEEDIKIQHTRKEDMIWFYGSVIAVPLLMIGAGFIATRRKKGVA